MLTAKYGKPLGSGDKSADETKGKPSLWIEAVSTPWIYLNDRQIEKRKLNRNAVAEEPGEVAAEAGERRPAFTRPRT